MGRDRGGLARAREAAAARAGPRIVLLDACHAGAVTQQLVVPTQARRHLVAGERAGALVFAASKGRQLSLETNAARALEFAPEDVKLIAHKPVPPRARPAAPAPPPPPAIKMPTAMHPRGGEGFFTAAVLASLDSPSTDTNGDGASRPRSSSSRSRCA